MAGLEPWVSPVIRSFERVLMRSHQGSFFLAEGSWKPVITWESEMSAGQVRGRPGKDVLTRIGLRFRRFCGACVAWKMGMECVNAVEFCLSV